MPLTRSAFIAISDRAHRDPEFMRSLVEEMVMLARNGERHLADSMLRKLAATARRPTAEPRARPAGQDRASPYELAAELGLIGGFRSAEGDLARNHSQHIGERLRAKRERESLPVHEAEAAAARVKRRRLKQSTSPSQIR